MKLWICAYLVASFVGAWVLTVRAQGAFEDCCLGYHSNIKWYILRHASRYWNQQVSGSCNLRAVIFYFSMKKRVMCGNPQDKDVQRAVNILKMRKKSNSNSMSFPALQAEKKKQNHGRSKVKNPSIRARNANTHHSRVVMTTGRTKN